jgi:hypothetical protein
MKLSKSAVATLAILLMAWLAVLWPLPKGLFKESDTFWLIEVGRNILRHLSLPSTDPYSFASLPTPWIIYQWLSEVVMGLVGSLGLTGVSILGEVTLALLLCVLIFRRMLTLGVNAIVAIVVITIAVHATYPDIATIRPQLFSFVFLFLLQIIVENVWDRGAAPQKLRYVLAKTFTVGVLWTNCHISFPVGLVILGLYTSGAVVRVLLHKNEDKTRLKVLACMTAVYLGATLVNPYGFKLWFFLRTLNDIYVAQEMQPLDWSRSGLYATVYCLLMVSTLFLWKTAARPRLLLAATLFAMGYLHARLIIYFCLSTCPLVGQAFSAMLPNIIRLPLISRASDAIKEVTFKWYYPLAVVLFSALVVLSQPIYLPKSIPLKAAEYLGSHKPIGNLFCSVSASSYLIYRFHGDIKVFIDGRLDRYDAALCRRYLATSSGMGWKELFAEYNIAEALLPNASPVNRAIEHDVDWEKIYQDEGFSISVRRSH